MFHSLVMFTLFLAVTTFANRFFLLCVLLYTCCVCWVAITCTLPRDLRITCISATFKSQYLIFLIKLPQNTLDSLMDSLIFCFHARWWCWYLCCFHNYYLNLPVCLEQLPMLIPARGLPCLNLAHLQFPLLVSACVEVPGTGDLPRWLRMFLLQMFVLIAIPECTWQIMVRMEGSMLQGLDQTYV